MEDPTYAICCQTEISVEMLNDMLAKDREKNPNAYGELEQIFTVVDSLHKKFRHNRGRPITNLAGFPFRGRSLRRIDIMLRVMVARTESVLFYHPVLVLDERSKLDYSIIMAERGRRGVYKWVRVPCGTWALFAEKIAVGEVEIEELINADLEAELEAELENNEIDEWARDYEEDDLKPDPMAAMTSDQKAGELADLIKKEESPSP